MAVDFSILPWPEAIEEIDFEEILEAILDDVVDRFVAAGILYDVGHLETDPVKMIVEAVAAREASVIRARINDGIRSNLLKFAAGANLDHLAAFYGVTRLPNEKDDPLRERVVLEIQGRSTGGSVEWYRAAARRADVRVKDAAVYTAGNSPDIVVSVLATDNFGVPDPELLEAVDAVLQSDAVRVVSDRITVVAATSVTVDVAAKVWLLPSAPQAVFEGLEAALRNALASEGGLGFDVAPSWIVSKLHQGGGVQKVELTAPVAGAVVAPSAAAKFGTVSLTYMGRQY